MRRPAQLSFLSALRSGLLLCLTLAMCAPAQAQETPTPETGRVAGQVVGPDGAPLAGINARLRGTPYGAATDQAGRYEIEAVPAGRYTLVLSSVGYEQQTRTVRAMAGEERTANVTLAPATQRLGEVVVRGARTEGYEADRPSRALRIQGPLVEAPQNIQVITGQLLDDQQLLNTREGVVRNVSGASESVHWAQFARINMRGSRIPAFRNGMNVSSNWGPLSQDASMIERVEFVKGPAGFMLANGEPAGFYNVVTEKPTSQTRRAVAFTRGSFDTYRATADFDGRLDRGGNWLYRLNLMGQQADSHVNYDFQNRYAVAPVLTYRFDDNTALTAEYTYQRAQFKDPGAPYQFSAVGFEELPRDFTLADPALDPTTIDDHSAFLTLDHVLSDQWQVTAKLAYFNYAVNGTSLWINSINAAGFAERSYTIWDSRLENKLGQIYVNGDFATGAVGHEVLAGLDVGNKDYLAVFGQGGVLGDSTFNVYDPTYGNLTDEDIPDFDRSGSLRSRANYTINQRHTALYAQDVIHFFDNRARLTLAGRLTDSRDDDLEERVFTPRAGLSVTVAPKTSVYGLYDQAYLPQAGIDSLGNGLEPVRGHNLEAGLKRAWRGGQWSSTLSTYRIVKNNVPNADPDNPNANYSVQLGQTRTWGVEADVRGQLLPGLNVVFNYAYTNSEITEDTDPALVGSRLGGARHITNTWLSYRLGEGPLRRAAPLLEGVGVSLGYRGQLDRRSNWAAEGSEQDLPDYFRLDGGLSWRNDRFEVALNVNNIFDRYLYSGVNNGSFYYWQTEPGRNFRLRVGYSF